MKIDYTTAPDDIPLTIQDYGYKSMNFPSGLRCSSLRGNATRPPRALPDKKFINRIVTIRSAILNGEGYRFPMKKSRGDAGFTIVEIMVVLGIVAVLAVLAAPSFSNIIASRSTKSAASELFSSLTKARSEAIARNANVTLSPLPGGWQNGWQVLSPTNVVLETRGAVKGATVTGPTSVIYRSSGRISGTTAPSFVFTATGDANIFQCVSVDLTGRPYRKAASSC